MSYSERVYEITQKLANETPGFFDTKGPGTGNRATYSFMKKLRRRTEKEFQNDYSEKRICGDNGFAVDFYFSNEAAIIEIALTIRNSNSEFHKDIIKAILSKTEGARVDQLVFISKPGAQKRHQEPASQSIISLVKKEFGISIIIRELSGGGF